jgi:hypothetical protein
MAAKLTNAQNHYEQISYTELRPSRKQMWTVRTGIHVHAHYAYFHESHIY